MASVEPQDKPRRKKIFWACNHCNKAHITCEEARPCSRCIKKGLQDTCADAPRKRKKYLADVPGALIEKSPELVPSAQSSHPPHQNEPLHMSLGAESAKKTRPEPMPKTGPRPPLYGATPVQHSASLPVPLLPKTSQMSSSVSVTEQTGRASPSLFSRDNYMGAYNEGYFPKPTPHNGDGLGPLPSNGNFQQHAQPSRPGIGTYYKSASSIHSAQSNHSYESDLRRSEGSIPQPQTDSNPKIIDQYPQRTSNSLPVEKKRPNFLSSAADMEYATLSSILQDSFLGINPNHSYTSNEGTPSSVNLSPALSPHTYETMAKVSPSSMTTNSFKNSNANTHLSKTEGRRKGAAGLQSQQYDTSAEFPPFDARINQYFLGSTLHYSNVKYPEVCEAISILEQNDPAAFYARNSTSSPSFTMGFPQGHAHNRNLLFKDPEEIYVKIKKPFSYTPGFHKLIAYLRGRFPRDMLVKMAESMAVYRPSFIACTNSLRESDLIFMEQCFQRTLLTYDNFIKVSGTPTIVWRRTGEIAYVGEEFTTLTGWTQEQLLGGRPTFIVELLDDKSVVEYFQLFSKIAFGDFLGATMTECTLLTSKENVKIRAGCSWTMKRDVFGIPMMIIGNFLPII